jgi:subtilase family protein/peptidase inhibitor I9
MSAVNSKLAQALFPLLTAALLATACNSDSTAPLTDGGGSGDAAEPSAAAAPALTPELSTTPELSAGTQNGEAGIAHLGVTPLEGAEAASLSASHGKGPIPGQYIIVFKDEVKDVPGLAKGLTSAHGGSLRHVYSNALKGFAARLPEQAAAALARNPHVSFVEQDQLVHASSIQQMPTGQPWGLDRIDQRSGLSLSYSYVHSGAGVTAYIIDGGLDSDHPDFGGRARNVATRFNANGEDCNGHGTHVAGTVGGRVYGVAKGVRLRGVKLFNCDGWASASDAALAVDWVYANRINPAVVNMSAGWFTSEPGVGALDMAMNRLAASGVFISVSAGNNSKNACIKSPARASGVFTTASSGSSVFVDDKAWDSNWGDCVEAYAPGYGIRSAKVGGGSIILSGTSMASPHVAGLAALLKQAYGNQSSPWITNKIKSLATRGAIRGNVTGTPNLLLFKAGL